MSIKCDNHHNYLTIFLDSLVFIEDRMNDTNKIEGKQVLIGVISEILGSLVIVLQHAFAIFLISKCRIVQNSIKILVTNLCIIDIIAGVWGCIRALFRLSSTDEEMNCRMDILFTTCIFNVSAFLVSAIAIDRYISVFFPMKYIQHVTKHALTLVCWILWSIGALIAFTTMFMEFTYTEKGCELRMSQKEIYPWFLIFLRVICISLMAFSYTSIYVKILSLEKIYSSGMKHGELRPIIKILLIVAPHLVLHVLYIILFVLKPIIKQTSTRALTIQSIFTTAVMFLDSIIYVFRFKECRLNISIYLCYCRKKFKDAQIQKRTLMYGTFLNTEKNIYSTENLNNDVVL